MDRARARRETEEFWYDRKMDESLNRWFASYDEAAHSLQEYGGYLLPFRDQFVVCEAAAIRALGLDPEDPDWDRIGHDLVRPSDQDAFRRLKARREDVRSRSGDRRSS